MNATRLPLIARLVFAAALLTALTALAASAALAQEPPPIDEAPPPAPTVNLAGRLIERGTRLPLAGVLVTAYRDDLDPPVGFEATSDGAGRFSFYDLTPGVWKLLVEAPGYYPFRTSETIAPGERVDVTYHLEQGAYNPYDVTVTGERPRKEVSRTIVSAGEIDKVPGGAGDPLAVITNFAGVARATTADAGSMPGSSAIVIRGAGPEDSRVLIDGSEIPILFHFGGLKSVIPVAVLDSIEFYPGNFSPQYGRANGGIVDIRVKRLAPKRVGGTVDVSILDAGFYLETPLGKRAGLALAARRSYLDAILGAVIPDDAGVSLSTAPVYYDAQVIANWRPTPAHDLRFFAFGSDDRLALLFDNPADADPGIEGNEFESVTTFYRAIASHRWVPSSRFENDLRVTVGRDETVQSFGQLAFDLTIQSAQVREAARWRWNDRLALTAGADLLAGVVDAFVHLPPPPKEGEPPSTGFDPDDVLTTNVKGSWQLDAAVFTEVEVSPWPGLVFFPGVRVDHFAQVDEVAVQPRLTARWRLAPAVTAKGGFGLFAQSPTYQELDPGFGNPDLGLERAIHGSLGVEVKPRSWLTLDVTGFYKRLDDLVSPTDAIVMEGGQARPLVYDNGGAGRVYGAELSVRHDFAHGLAGWLAYTLSRSERRDSGSDSYRLFDHDQTHILSAVASWLLPRNWQIGGRFRLVSGNPNTPVVGSVYNASTDVYQPIFGPVNSGRNAMFHQLDLRVDKRWIRRNWIFGAYLDMQNVYSYEAAEGFEYSYDFSEKQVMSGAPIFVILGLRAEL